MLLPNTVKVSADDEAAADIIFRLSISATSTAPDPVSITMGIFNMSSGALSSSSSALICNCELSILIADIVLSLNDRVCA